MTLIQLLWLSELCWPAFSHTLHTLRACKSDTFGLPHCCPRWYFFLFMPLRYLQIYKVNQCNFSLNLHLRPNIIPKTLCYFWIMQSTLMKTREKNKRIVTTVRVDANCCTQSPAPAPAARSHANATGFMPTKACHLVMNMCQGDREGCLPATGLAPVASQWSALPVCRLATASCKRACPQHAHWWDAAVTLSNQSSTLIGHVWPHSGCQ